MYMQNQGYSGPVIEEVLADGTIISIKEGNFLFFF